MNPDFRDLLAGFNAHGVEYLVVGAHALAAHGHVRATKDLDVFVRLTLENARKVMQSLEAACSAISSKAQMMMRTRTTPMRM